MALENYSVEEIRDMLKLIPNDFPIDNEDLEVIFNLK